MQQARSTLDPASGFSLDWKFCDKLDQNCGCAKPKRTAVSPAPWSTSCADLAEEEDQHRKKIRRCLQQCLILYPDEGLHRVFWSTNVSIEISSTKWGPILEKGTSGFDQHVDDFTSDEPIAAHMCLTQNISLGLSENSVPLNPMVFMIIIPIKWLFHWEYTQHFQTNPTMYSMFHTISHICSKVRRWSLLLCLGFANQKKKHICKESLESKHKHRPIWRYPLVN